MSTWGKLKIRTSKYAKDSTLYYDYLTSVDSFHFIYEWLDDDWGGTGKVEKRDEYQSMNDGIAQMEAYIHHFLAFNCSGDIDRFVERYIKNNRFADEWNRIEKK